MLMSMIMNAERWWRLVTHAWFWGLLIECDANEWRRMIGYDDDKILLAMVRMSNDDANICITKYADNHDGGEQWWRWLLMTGDGDVADCGRRWWWCMVNGDIVYTMTTNM